MFFSKKALLGSAGNIPIPGMKAPLGLRGLLVRIIVVTAIANFLWGLWTQFGFQKPQADSIRTAAAIVAAEHIGDDLRENRQNIRSLTLLNFAHDPTDLISDDLRQRLGSAGTFLLADRSFFNKVRLSLNLPQSVITDSAVALNLGKRNRTDGVLYGTVHQFETVKGRAMIHIDYYLVDSQTGEIIYSGVYDNRTKPADTSASATIPEMFSTLASAVPGNGSGWLGLLGWLLIVLLLPIFTIWIIIVLTEKRSNLVNFFVLTTYTAIGAFFAWFLIVPNWESYLSLILFVLLCGVAFWYNVQVMSFAVRYNEP